MESSKGTEAPASRVLQILGALAKTPQASVKQLAESTMIPPSTLYRLLAPLVAAGFARKTSNRQYCAGPVAVQLAERYRDAEPATGALERHLRQLAEASGELAAFMVVRGTEAVCLAEIESRHTLRAAYTVGAAVPLLRGATAISLLAWMPEATRRSILEHYDLPATQREDLEARCARARADGYAASTGELDAGIWGVSVPVFGDQNQLAGTLTLMAPSERSRHKEEELIELVRGTAATLGKGMP